MYRYLIAFQHRVTRLCADNPYGIALWLSFGFCIAHVLALPLLVTFDGYSYAKLAEAIGTARFEQDWDYLRGPVFPLLLKASFGLFGRNALTVIALQSTLGFGGICLIGATLKRWGRPLEAAATVMVLSAFPTLVTYEHALLTEAGTFFFLALLVYVVTAPLVTPWKPAF